MTELAARLLVYANAGLPLPLNDVRELVKGLAWLEAEADRYQRLREAAAKGKSNRVKLALKGKKLATESEIDQEIDAMLVENGVKLRRPWKEILEAMPADKTPSTTKSVRVN